MRLGLSICRKEKKTGNSERRLKTQFTGLESEGTKGRVIVQLICAEQILPLDEEGTSDPFFEFTFMDKSVFSTTRD